MIEIRRAEPADWDGIVDVGGVLGYANVVDRSSLVSILNSDRETVLVAVNEGGALVGWVHAVCASRLLTSAFVEIAGIAVSEASRRVGVGRSLFGAVCEWASKTGAASAAGTRVRVRVRVDRVERTCSIEGLALSKRRHSSFSIMRLSGPSDT
jgi:N-acetylglutamate synthase-like GNAT family acetyltransferase